MMKSWECDCGRINPPAEKKCLSCKALRAVENTPLKPMNIQWTADEIQNICNKYAGNPTKCLSPSGEVKIPTKILAANPAGDFEEVWMKTTDDLCILVKKGDKWAETSTGKEFSDDEKEILEFWKKTQYKKAEELLVKHIGVGGYGNFVSCSTKPLLDAIVEAFNFNNLKSK